MHLFKEALIGQALCAFTYIFFFFFHWQTDKKRAWENMCREKPNVVQDREHEKNLQKIATRWNIIQSTFAPYN